MLLLREHVCSGRDEMPSRLRQNPLDQVDIVMLKDQQSDSYLASFSGGNG